MALNRKKCVNPLFEKWIFEWKQLSAQSGSKLEFTYGKALRSLREHDQVLNSGEECRKLKGFGDKICKKIDEKLKQHRNECVDANDVTNNGTINDPLPSSSMSSQSSSSHSQRTITDMMTKKKRPRYTVSSPSIVSPLKKRTRKRYIPSEGSGAYAILIALYKADVEEGRDFLGKEQLKNAAQEFAITSMSVPIPGSRYTAFNSIKTLINKNLVERNRERFASYFLTEEGKDIAQRLYQMHCEKTHQKHTNVNHNEVLLSDSEWSDIEIPRSLSSQCSSQMHSQSSSQFNTQNSVSTQSSTSSRTYDHFTLSPQTFDIVICVDTREQSSGVSKEMRKTALLSALQQRDLKVELRTLAVGDFLWIVQEKARMSPTISSSVKIRKELVLDFVIERKRIDDLGCSIKDRRWYEQKFRLKNCGVRKPTYIIEYFGAHSRNGDFSGIKRDALDQAVINAEIDGFMVKRCDNFEETVRYLTLMTRYLESYYKNRTLHSCSREEMINKEVSSDHFMTFDEYAKSATKITNFTVTEMFAKHLLQIRGVSVNKAKVIIDHYPTLQSLLDAYSIIDNDKEKEQLLSSLKCGLTQRNFGPNLSAKIYRYYYNR